MIAPAFFRGNDIDACVTFPRRAGWSFGSGLALDGKGHRHHFLFFFVFGSGPSAWGSKPI
jgi:hypothetical protein